MDLIAAMWWLAMVHAENGLVTDYFEDRSLQERRGSKDGLSEDAAGCFGSGGHLSGPCRISAVMDSPLYIVHVSTAKGIEIMAAKADGQMVYAETCPNTSA